MPPGRRRHTAAAATMPPRPHCCCHTAAAPPHPARQCHSRRCRPVEDTPTAATTPAASIPAAATSAATRYPDHHRHAGTGQPHPCHSALSLCHRAARDTLPAAATPVSETPTRSPSSPALKPQVNGPRTPPTPLCMASTRAHAGWFTRRCVELPSTNPTKSIQNQYNNRPTTHTTTVQQPYNNRTKTRTKTRTLNPSSGGPPMRNTSTRKKGPKGGAGATPRHLRYGAAGEAGGLPEGPPQPRRTPRAAPAPPLVTLRHGATRAPGGPPEGPPLLSKK